MRHHDTSTSLERTFLLESVFEKKSNTNERKLTARTGARSDTIGLTNGLITNVRLPHTTPAKTPEANLDGIVVRSPRKKTAIKNAPEERRYTIRPAKGKV
jgi:hypothetical protein